MNITYDTCYDYKIIEGCRIHPHSYFVENGIEVWIFLCCEPPTKAIWPNLILLDLNMLRKSGCKVLHDMQQDKVLHSLLVMVLKVSDSDSERAYDLDSSASKQWNEPNSTE